MRRMERGPRGPVDRGRPAEGRERRERPQPSPDRSDRMRDRIETPEVKREGNKAQDINSSTPGQRSDRANSGTKTDSSDKD